MEISEQEYLARVPKLATAAVIVMAATLLSRIFGLVREQVMAAYFGAHVQIDAYRVAFILPNLFRMLLADAAIGSAFIPVFTSYLARGDRKGAWEVCSSVINLMVLILCLFLGLGMIFAPQLISILAPGFTNKPYTFKLALIMTRILFPSVLFMALAGVVMGILNSYNHFTAPALSPVLWNFIIIACILFLAPKMGVVSLALGIVVGSLFQFLMQLPFVSGKGARYSLIFNWHHPGVKEVGALLLPVVISLASWDINIIVDTRFASRLITGSVASLGYAIRLWQLPLGLFAIAISTVLFPTFSRQVVRNDIQGLKNSLSLGVRTLFLIMLPASVGLMTLGIPIIRLLFERGRFTPTATLLTASALFYYAVGLFAAGELHLVNRAFYSLKDTITPMVVAGLSIIVNYFGDWFFMIYLPIFAKLIGLPSSLSWLGYAHGGIALSTSLVCFFNLVVLMEILRRRLGGVDGKKIAISFAKISFASIILGVVAFYGWRVTVLYVGVSLLGQILSLGVGILLGVIIYIGVATLLKIEELHFAYQLIATRLKGRP